MPVSHPYQMIPNLRLFVGGGGVCCACLLSCCDGAGIFRRNSLRSPELSDDTSLKSPRPESTGSMGLGIGGSDAKKACVVCVFAGAAG